MCYIAAFIGSLCDHEVRRDYISPRGWMVRACGRATGSYWNNKVNQQGYQNSEVGLGGCGGNGGSFASCCSSGRGAVVVLFGSCGSVELGPQLLVEFVLSSTLFNHCTMELVSTEEGTFNFWALEVTDLKENFFCSIPGALCVQRMRVYRIIRLQSLLPLCP